MYQRILVPVDGSATSNQGLNEALKLASLTHGRLLLLHAIDDPSFSFALQASMPYTNDWHEFMRQDGEVILDRARNTAKAAGIQVETVLSDRYARPVYERIVAEADHWKADLIVIGTHGRRGFQRMILGSSAEGVLRVASVPVLLVRASEEKAEAHSTRKAAIEDAGTAVVE